MISYEVLEVYCYHNSQLGLSKLSQFQAFKVPGIQKYLTINEKYKSSLLLPQNSCLHQLLLFKMPLAFFLQVLFNKIYFQTLMNSSARLLGDQYQDSQVESMDCCAPLVRSSSSVRSISNTRLSHQSLKDGKEKGIKLTYKPKTAKFITENKLAIKLSEPLSLNPRSSLKQSESPQLGQSNQIISSPSIKKATLVQKCIDYKNKRIEEHSKGQLEYRSSHHLESSQKQEQLCSTQKHTARTLKNSEDCSEREALNFLNSIRVEQSWKVGFGSSQVLYIIQDKLKLYDGLYSQQKLVIGSRQNVGKKTLEKVFEETQGRRIVTLESQYQNEEISNEHSIAEPFEFPRPI